MVVWCRLGEVLRVNCVIANGRFRNTNALTELASDKSYARAGETKWEVGESKVGEKCEIYYRHWSEVTIGLLVVVWVAYRHQEVLKVVVTMTIRMT